MEPANILTYPSGIKVAPDTPRTLQMLLSAIYSTQAMSTINNSKCYTTLPVAREDLHALWPLKNIDKHGFTDSEDESPDPAWQGSTL